MILKLKQYTLMYRARILSRKCSCVCLRYQYYVDKAGDWVVRMYVPLYNAINAHISLVLLIARFKTVYYRPKLYSRWAKSYENLKFGFFLAPPLNLVRTSIVHNFRIQSPFWACNVESRIFWCDRNSWSLQLFFNLLFLFFKFHSI